MGNLSSTCFYVETNTANLIDLRRNILRLVEVPITAAELMLEDPGHVISPVTGLRDCGYRISALKADESLIRGGVYVLIPAVSRVHGKVTESETAVIKAACGDRRAKRRSAKVMPVLRTETSSIEVDPIKLLVEVSESGVLSCRTRHWKPTLEPIYEGL